MSYGIDSYGVNAYGSVATVDTGPVTHTAGGSLVTGNSVVVGSASRTGAVITHTATGAILAQSSTVSGTTSHSSYNLRICIIGDSNASGRGSFSQTHSAALADLYDNSGNIITLADPWDGGSQTYSVLDDTGSFGGSYVPKLADLFDIGGQSTLWIPANKGGTKASDWAYSTNTTTCYGAMKARIDAAGGVDVIIIHLGANDAISAVSQATFTSQMTAIIGHLVTDFPTARIYLQKIHHNSSATVGAIDAIRASVDELWANVPGLYIGADLEGITTSVHYGQTGNTTTCTAELNEVASRTYVALTTTTHLSTGTLSANSASIAGRGNRPNVIVPILAPLTVSVGMRIGI